MTRMHIDPVRLEPVFTDEPAWPEDEPTHEIVRDLAESICPSGECDLEIHTREQYAECEHLARLMNDPGPPPDDPSWASVYWFA